MPPVPAPHGATNHYDCVVETETKLAQGEGQRMAGLQGPGKTVLQGNFST